MKNIEELEEDIRIGMLSIYYCSWGAAINDDMKGRRLYITKIQGQYGNGAGYIFAIEGTPPRGMVYFDCTHSILWFYKGGKWKDLMNAKKHMEIRCDFVKWKKLKEDIEKKEIKLTTKLPE